MKHDGSSTKIPWARIETWWNYKHCALGMIHDGTTNTVHWEWTMTELQTLCTGNEPWFYKYCALGMNHDWTTNTVHWEWTMTELQTQCTGNEPWQNYKHSALGMNHDWTTNTVHWEWTTTELQTQCTGNEIVAVLNQEKRLKNCWMSSQHLPSPNAHWLA